MTNRPIILTDWQVRAVQEGRLTQIRVPVVPQPQWEETPMLCDDGLWRGRYRYQCGIDDFGVEWETVRPPFQLGDILYVKEAWAWGKRYSDDYALTLKAIPKIKPDYAEIWYRADDVDVNRTLGWRSAVHMPAWAVRYWMTVGEVRVQRLGEMNGNDLWAEGLGASPEHRTPYIYGAAKQEFKHHWDARYARKGYPWAEGLWTFVGTVKAGGVTT